MHNLAGTCSYISGGAVSKKGDALNKEGGALNNTPLLSMPAPNDSRRGRSGRSSRTVKASVAGPGAVSVSKANGVKLSPKVSSALARAGWGFSRFGRLLRRTLRSLSLPLATAGPLKPGADGARRRDGHQRKTHTHAVTAAWDAPRELTERRRSKVALHHTRPLSGPIHQRPSTTQRETPGCRVANGSMAQHAPLQRGQPLTTGKQAVDARLLQRYPTTRAQTRDPTAATPRRARTSDRRNAPNAVWGGGGRCCFGEHGSRRRSGSARSGSAYGASRKSCARRSVKLLNFSVQSSGKGSKAVCGCGGRSGVEARRNIKPDGVRQRIFADACCPRGGGRGRRSTGRWALRCCKYSERQLPAEEIAQHSSGAGYLLRMKCQEHAQAPTAPILRGPGGRGRKSGGAAMDMAPLHAKKAHLTYRRSGLVLMGGQLGAQRPGRRPGYLSGGITASIDIFAGPPKLPQILICSSSSSLCFLIPLGNLLSSVTSFIKEQC